MEMDFEKKKKNLVTKLMTEITLTECLLWAVYYAKHWDSYYYYAYLRDEKPVSQIE